LPQTNPSAGQLVAVAAVAPHQRRALQRGFQA